MQHQDYLQFYPEIEPFNHFMMDTNDGHQIYVEQVGNPKGEPVIFLHGGPGAGCGETDRRFFDPEYYHVILLDQRGCGRSLPHGSLENNSTQTIIKDIEQIRETLNIDAWHVFGGSWGSTLSLAYAQAHPDRAKRLILRGIFLARQHNSDWLFGGGGASEIFPDYWQEYETILRKYIGDAPLSIQAAHDIMVGEDRAAALEVAQAWAKWEISSCSLLPNPDYVAETEDDDFCWTLARHEAHFMVNQCFLEEGQLIRECDKIKDHKIHIVHGRYDIVCTTENAHTLMKHLNNADLIISKTAGHSSSEPETKHHLISIMNDIRDGAVN